MRYYAITDNMTQAVLRLRDNLQDYQDYGVRVPAPGGGWAWGWIETERPLTPGLPGALGLVPVPAV